MHERRTTEGKEQNSYMNNVGTPHQKAKPQAEKKNEIERVE